MVIGMKTIFWMGLAGMLFLAPAKAEEFYCEVAEVTEDGVLAYLMRAASDIRISKKAAESRLGRSAAKSADRGTGEVGRAKRSRSARGLELCFVTGAFQANGVVEGQGLKLRVKRDGTHTYTSEWGVRETVPKYKLLKVLKKNPPR